MLARHERAQVFGWLKSAFNRLRKSIVDFLTLCISHEIDGLDCTVLILTYKVRRVVLEILKVWQKGFVAWIHRYGTDGVLSARELFLAGVLAHGPAPNLADVLWWLLLNSQIHLFKALFNCSLNYWFFRTKLVFCGDSCVGHLVDLLPRLYEWKLTWQKRWLELNLSLTSSVLQIRRHM